MSVVHIKILFCCL